MMRKLILVFSKVRNSSVLPEFSLGNAIGRYLYVFKMAALYLEVANITIQPYRNSTLRGTIVTFFQKMYVLVYEWDIYGIYILRGAVP